MKKLLIILMLCCPVFADDCKDSLKICEKDLQETKDHRDYALTRAWEAELRTTGLLEVGACILVGTGVGLIAKNMWLGAASAGLGCAIALPY